MILELEVENYKSIEKMSLSFGRVNVLIGKNGAGKTTLVSVIGMLKEIASGRNINTIINKIAPYGEIFNANVNSPVLKISAKIQTKEDHVFRYSFSIGFGASNGSLLSRLQGVNGYYFINEKLVLLENNGKNEILLFERNADEEGIKVDTSGRNIPQRVDGSVSALSAYSQDQVREFANTLSTYSILWIDNEPSTISGLQFANDLDLSTIDGVAVGLFLKDKTAYDKSMEIVKEIIPGFTPPNIKQLPLDSKNEVTDSAQTGYFVSWHDGGYTERMAISSGSISGGNHRVIYLILSLFYSDAKTCFVAEEIENGMHMRRLSNLMDKLKMIGKNRKMQLFFTTHNHLILNDLLPQEVILAKMGDHGSSYLKLSDTHEYEDIKADLGRDPTGREIAESGLLF